MSEMKTTPGPTILPAQMDAALAEYARWGTGFDSARARDISHWVFRMDDRNKPIEMTGHRGSERAEEARHVQALRAALEAAISQADGR